MSSKKKDSKEKSSPAAGGSREKLSEIANDIRNMTLKSEATSGETLRPMFAEFQDLLAKLEKDGDDLGDGGMTSAKLAGAVKEMSSALDDYDNCGSDEEEEADFISSMAQKIAASPKPPSATSVKEGVVAMVHSLQSAGGKKLNGSRVVVLRHNPGQEDRWEVRVEFEKGYNATKSLKGANLTTLRRLPLPTGNYRGFADIDNFDTIVPKLCELLLRSTDDFSPSDIMFTGYGSMAFQRMEQFNFMEFYASQMEQMGGVLGLGNLCREAEEPGTEAAVFGLLEGDEMYIDVLIQTMCCTGEIIKEEDSGERSGFNCPPTQLTPDQDTPAYVRTMKEGPMLILECVAKYSFAPALWAALGYSEFYHLLIQRLLRWVAREAKKTNDGKGLGSKARMLLSSMFPEIAGSLKQPISVEAAEKILSESSALLSKPSSITIANMKCLLDS
eukprot:CAMPEP_0172311392 /NCGR_PEP_ID=MMETSP1058-20130122/14646_1 /TAXON_ID=83371 /ORGANISM="Detonula confervacea, Strain CCMP 353" /LENGTH=443 /DNA_ID=CAMNT_0013024555 /DNA_START=75 /DNA_END=1402 /DNA_ORIENTATION=-